MDTVSIENIADVKYTDEGILYMIMQKNSHIDSEGASMITEAASELAGDKVHANLVDIRNMTFMTGEARKHFGSQNKKTVKAVGVVSNAMFHRPLINLYLKFSRPLLPTKFFNDEDPAREWLLEQLKR